MKKPDYHFLLCLSFRGLEAKGKCVKKGSPDLLPYLESELADRGISGLCTSAGCMKYCDQGPIMVVYPRGDWYGGVDSEEAVDEILDAVAAGRACEARLLA
ncbi:MAG: (2Fe-2S) ferredoxin domain-containing protein [Pseudomonadota bacterium]